MVYRKPSKPHRRLAAVAFADRITAAEREVIECALWYGRREAPLGPSSTASRGRNGPAPARTLEAAVADLEQLYALRDSL